MFLSLPDPFPKEVKDSSDLYDFFKGLKVVPYYSAELSSGHGMLELLTTLASLSPTFRAAMLDLSYYTFGRKIDIVNRARMGLVEDESVDLEFSDKTDFDDYLKSLNIKLTKIIKLSKIFDHHLHISGNTYLLVKRIVVGELVRYEFRVPHFKHCVYVRSIDLDEEFIMVSKYLGDFTKMSKYPPKILRVTYIHDDELKFIDTDVDGVQEAIIHIKKENFYDESEFYSRPDILACLSHMYTDFQLGNLSSKVAGTDLITKILLAMEAPDPAAQGLDNLETDDGQLVDLSPDGKIGGKPKAKTVFQQNMWTIKELMTNISGHPTNPGGQRTSSSIGGIEYPHGANPPKAIPLEVNRDVKSWEWQTQHAITTICAILQWSPELLMLRQTKTGLGGNLLHDIFVMMNESTITPRQIWYEGVWNTLLGWIFELENAPDDIKEKSIKFQDVITDMLLKFSSPKGTGAGEDETEKNIIEPKIQPDESDDLIEP